MHQLMDFPECMPIVLYDLDIMPLLKHTNNWHHGRKISSILHCFYFTLAFHIMFFNEVKMSNILDIYIY